MTDRDGFSTVTATVTMCRRLHSFCQTMDSLLENVRDRDLIEEWVAIDDGSSTSDLRKVSNRYPFLRILINVDKGHPYALNNLFAEVTTRFVFHFEDDWLFKTEGHYIRDGFRILERDPSIGVVCLRQFGGQLFSVDGLEYYLHEHGREGVSSWPGFTLNPSLQDLNKLREVGPFHDVPWFEHQYAERFSKKGYRVVYLKPPKGQSYIEHIGHASAYALNGTKR